MMFGFAARGQDKSRMGLPKARCPKKASAPFLVEEKQTFAPPSFPTNPNPYKPQGACRRRANVSRLGGIASFGVVSIGRDKAKSRWFSKSKSACAGASGKFPRLCAIWTPQCGGMKGKLCFIKRKSKTLVSNNRIFRDKNILFFENRKRLNKKLVDFLAKLPSFSLLPPHFWGKRRALLPNPAVRRFFLRSFVRADGHAPAHRALSEFAILAFTLHLHPQCVDTVCLTGEGMCPFLPSPVKERWVKPSPASH